MTTYLAFHRHLDRVAIKEIDFPSLYDFAYWFTAEISFPNPTPRKVISQGRNIKQKFCYSPISIAQLNLKVQIIVSRNN